jgi:hypothetical protein
MARKGEFLLYLSVMLNQKTTQHLITAHHGRLPDPSYLVRAFLFSITSASDSICRLQAICIQGNGPPVLAGRMSICVGRDACREVHRR